MVFIGARANEVEITAVSFGAFRHQSGDFHFGSAFRHFGQLACFQFGRNFIEQGIDVRRADGGEHFSDVLFGVGNEWHD